MITRRPSRTLRARTEPRFCGAGAGFLGGARLLAETVGKAARPLPPPHTYPHPRAPYQKCSLFSPAGSAAVRAEPKSAPATLSL